MSADAFGGRVRAARPLPAHETLTPEDYRRLVGVLEAVDRAADLTEFRERLLRAVQTWFGFAGVTVLHGPDLAAATEQGCGVQAGYTRAFLDEYAERWAAVDPMRTPHAAALLAETGVVTLAELADGPGYLDAFLRPHGITDKAAMLIDAGARGIVLVSFAVQRAGLVSERDVAVLRALRRHLAPQAVELLTRDAERRAAASRWRLTPREWEVAELAAQGLTNREIARRLFVGADTVKKHLTRVLAETGSPSRTHLALKWPTRPTQ
ncbi:helix-turn-helix transcriptional regulator [Actinocorallia sp. A-T 12471]|uniref:helix-turn-helix transcriptional regulator n=1 Tax=Actinocorallia sp. A-T 12471 TaxID=3089813 RepID=UPI0029CE33C6|nr:LuxR C-terminal-related transcriptional regulator [Actinocorallia sp. A-T 12471]MDX6742494.1 LuxR C-terminal-related transcriptional regulator [Actinocorallia sp. A-T 12471]